MRTVAVPRFVGRPLEDEFTVLFIFLALIYGVVQLFILSSPSRTIRLRSILFGFVAGMSASASAAILIERGSAFLFAAALHRSLSSVPLSDSYTSDPIIEEFCKVLPFLLVLLIPRVRTRLGFSDIVVMCAALGSGFAFTETTLRFGYGAGAAHWSAGFWLINQGFSSVGVPGIGAILRSWLPVGVTSVGLFARPNLGLNTHLIWSAIVGLSICIALRGRGKWKWMALLPFIFACLDHATSNAAQLRVRFPFMLSPALAAMRHFAVFYALVPLVVAICLDRSVFKRGLADELTVALPAERQGRLGMIALALGHLRKPKFLRDLWSYALLRRAFACTKAVNPSDKSLPIDRARLAAMGAILEREVSPSSPVAVARLAKAPSRPVYQRIIVRRVQLVWLVVLALPPALFFVIGDFPWTARLQTALATRLVYHTLLCLLIASMIWQILVLIGQTRGLSYMRRNGSAQALLLYGLSLSTAVGALVFSLISLVALRNHSPLQQIGQCFDGLFNFSLSNALTLVGIGLLLGGAALLLPLVGSSLAPLFLMLSAAAELGSVYTDFNPNQSAPHIPDLSMPSPEVWAASVLVMINSVGDAASVPTTPGEAVVSIGVEAAVPDPPAAETTSVLLRNIQALRNLFSYVVWDGNTEKATRNFDKTWKSGVPQSPNASR